MIKLTMNIRISKFLCKSFAISNLRLDCTYILYKYYIILLIIVYERLVNDTINNYLRLNIVMNISV